MLVRQEQTIFSWSSLSCLAVCDQPETLPSPSWAFLIGLIHPWTHCNKLYIKASPKSWIFLHRKRALTITIVKAKNLRIYEVITERDCCNGGYAVCFTTSSPSDVCLSLVWIAWPPVSCPGSWLWGILPGMTSIHYWSEYYCSPVNLFNYFLSVPCFPGGTSPGITVSWAGTLLVWHPLVW